MDETEKRQKRNGKTTSRKTLRNRAERAGDAKGGGIAYQNKDITSKVFAEHFKGKPFRVYGLDVPDIRAVLPTNIPVVRANELRLDNLFELVDGTVALVDYESDYKEEDKVYYRTLNFA